MKKLLYGIMGVSLLLILSLAGCDNGDVNATNKVALQTLAAPTNVKATAFGATGVIRVTWEPVANAKSYDVYRKDVASSKQGGETLFKYKGNVQAASTGSGGYVGYEDVISTTNEFKPGVTYTYKIVAISNWSSYTGSSGAVWNPQEALALQNSSANSNSVSFDDPATSKAKNPLLAVGSKLDAPDIDLKVVKSYSTTSLTESLQVSWDVSPGLTYIVYYSYGSDVLVFYGTGFYNQPTLVPGQTKAVSTFPLINGNTNVQLVAKTASGYYQDSDPVSKNYTGAQSVLPAVTLAASAANGVVKLSWVDVYQGAATYQVYRFTSKTGYANNATSPGYIFDDWTLLADFVYHNDPTYTGQGTQLAGYDSDQHDQNLYYVYMLIATLTDKDGNVAKSIPTAASVKQEQNPVTAATPAVRFLNSPTNWDANLKAFSGVQIHWNAVAGQTYKLYRTAINYDINSSAILGPKTGTWEDTAIWTDLSGSISTIPSINDGDNMDIGLVDKPPVKDAYMYKLVTSQVTTQGATLTAEKFASLTQSPYQNSVSITLNPTNEPTPAANAASSTWSIRQDRGTAYTIGLTLTTDKYMLNALKGSDTVKIFRAKTDASGYELDQWQEVPANIIANFLDGKQVIDTPPEPGYYEYKAAIVLSDGITQIPNPENTTTPVMTSYTPVSPAIQTVNGNRVLFVDNTANYIDKQEVHLRYVTATDTTDATNKFNLGDYTDLQFTLNRTNTTTVDTTQYSTISGTIPAQNASGDQRYYQVWAKNGSGEIRSVRGTDLIP